MAVKRMISSKITRTDAFLGMPMSSRYLYYELIQEADDVGVVDNPLTVIRLTGCSQDDLKVLTTKRFILPFEEGVVVIKHWLIHNTIRKDRFIDTNYPRVKEQLYLKENKSYTLDPNKGQAVGLPSDNQVTTGGCRRLDKTRLDKTRLDLKETSERPKKPSQKQLILNLINEYTNNQTIKDLLNEFIFTIRVKRKAVNSERAIKLLLTELDKGATDPVKIKMLEMAITNGYKSVYVPNNNYNNKPASRKPDWHDEYKQERAAKDQQNKKQDEDRLKDVKLEDIADKFKNL